MEIIKRQDGCYVVQEGCTISELISILSTIKKEKGDLNVKVGADEDTPNFNVRFIETNKNYVWLTNSE